MLNFNFSVDKTISTEQITPSVEEIKNQEEEWQKERDKSNINKFVGFISFTAFLLFFSGVLLFLIFNNYPFNKMTLFVVISFLYLLVLITSFISSLTWTLNTTGNNIWNFWADFSLLLLMAQSIMLILFIIILIVVLVMNRKHFNN